MLVFFIGIGMTIVASISLQKKEELYAKQEFNTVCKEIENKIIIRLHTHAQLLRSGAALFSAFDSVSRKEWKVFFDESKIEKNLPGIQGVGFSLIIPKDKLKQHIQSFRKQGFSDYIIKPAGERAVYTSIVYLEPFLGSNLRAFGYDMYSEAIRRKAMQQSCDYDIASLSGKVVLVQEIEKNTQAGILMYVPVYYKGMQTNTVEQRRTAIKGWVYSPYRMNDLMNGILGHWDLIKKERIHLMIYDDSISTQSLMYNSQVKSCLINKDSHFQTLSFSGFFNDKKWILCFSQSKEEFLHFNIKVIIIFIFGLIISFLLFALYLSIINTKNNAIQIADKLTFELKENEVKLLRINVTKNKFFSIIAHDLRSPFNSFLGLTQIMAEELPSLSMEEVQKFADSMRKSAANLYRLLENLLEWSQLQQSLIPHNPEFVCLLPLVNESVEMILESAKNKQIEIIIEISLDIEVYAENNSLQTIIRNLVSNAVKYTPKGGNIQIFAKSNSDSSVEISIKDTGIGMKPSMIDNLFKLDVSTSRKGTEGELSTGLGLLLCKEFVEKHGGKLWVESEEGKGSTFRFTLPTIIRK
ncbi:MAG: CHASE domain-containing sensor histidine kinase [Bacteroidales bacterium]